MQRERSFLSRHRRQVGLAAGGVAVACAVVAISIAPSDPKPLAIEYSDSLFARIVTAEPAAQKRWSWPEPSVFRDAWTDASQRARPIAALLGLGSPVYDKDISPDERGETAAQTKENQIKRAIEAGDDALARSLYRRYRPAMRCSMDDYPERAAQSYADFCDRVGELGCLLQIQVQTLGNRAQGSASPEEADRLRALGERLAESGLDVDRFLRGLALRYAGVKHRTEITEGSFARAALELGRGDAFAAAFTRIAQDPNIDEYNRLRAERIADDYFLCLAIAAAPSGRFSDPAPDGFRDVGAAHGSRSSTLGSDMS
jgi:hypothetical protein